MDSILSAPPILERFSLAGRTAFVTGGGTGIGRSIAHAFVEAGARVAVAGRRVDRLEKVAHELVAKGGDAIAVEVDVSDEESVTRGIATVAQHFGGLTIGVNNAGAFGMAPAEEMSLDDWHRVLGVNLTGVFMCAQAEARVMLPAGYGKIINVTSISGTVINAGVRQAAYNASKAGAIHLARALAVEWAPRRVCINSLSPGHTASSDEAYEASDAPEDSEARRWVDRVIAETPMKGILPATAIQGAAVFLASEASDWATGIDLVVDGGYVLP
jgi:NAD(P)-dependent dehydrogenase (short-subunit alcohol dehydrogenase family)